MLSVSGSYAFRVWELCYSILLAYSDWLRLSYYSIPLIFILKKGRRCLYISISGIANAYSSYAAYPYPYLYPYLYLYPYPYYALPKMPPHAFAYF